MHSKLQSAWWLQKGFHASSGGSRGVSIEVLVVPEGFHTTTIYTAWNSCIKSFRLYTCMCKLLFCKVKSQVFLAGRSHLSTT